MGVDSFPRVSEHGAENGLKIDQSGGDGAKPAESPAVGDRLGRLVRYANPAK